VHATFDSRRLSMRPGEMHQGELGLVHVQSVHDAGRPVACHRVRHLGQRGANFESMHVELVKADESLGPDVPATA